MRISNYIIIFIAHPSVDGLHTYCSSKCWGLNHQTSKEKIIDQLQKLSQELGRSPTKRECLSYVDQFKLIIYFSSKTAAICLSKATTTGAGIKLWDFTPLLSFTVQGLSVTLTKFVFMSLT